MHEDEFLQSKPFPSMILTAVSDKLHSGSQSLTYHGGWFRHEPYVPSKINYSAFAGLQRHEDAPKAPYTALFRFQLPPQRS